MKFYQTERFQTLILFAAILCVGYIASLFLTYSFIVMPGLATIGDSAFVAAFQGLETRFQTAKNPSPGIGNLPALIAFPGAFLFSITALLLHWKKSYNKWIIAAIVFFALGMITTVLYNLPANLVIFSAGDPTLIDATQVRKDFNEVAWLHWNHFRAATSSLAMFCLMWALYVKVWTVGGDKNISH